MRRIAIVIALALLVALALSAPSRAATLVVGPGGYATIQAAINAAQAGDVITVRAGTYNETVVPRSGLTITDYGDGPVVIDRQCAASHGFYVAAVSNVVIRGMTVTNTRGASVFLEEGASSVTIDRMTLQNFDCQWSGQDPASWGQYRGGVAAWYSGGGIKITNNIIRHRTSGEVRGAADPIWFKSNDANPSGGGHYIAGNIIIGGWDGIGGEEEGSAHGTFDRDTVVENNTIRDAWDDCIQSEGGDQNVRIRNNDLSGCGTGIALAAPITGPLYIEGNTIHDLVTGLYDNHVCFKVGTNGSSSAVTYLTGNSCDVRGGQEANGIHQSGGDNMTPIVARNNRWILDGYLYYIADIRGQDYDYSCIDKRYTVTDNLAKWAGVYYATLAAFRAGTGQEAHGQLVPCGVSPTPTVPRPTIIPTLSPTPAVTQTPPPATATPTPTLPRCQVRVRIWLNGAWRERWLEKEPGFCASR